MPADTHGNPTTRDGLWCFDLEGFPTGIDEMSPSAASTWGELFDEVGATQRPALLTWVETGCYITEGAEDFPNIGDFEDAYQGEWDSFTN